MAIAPLDRAELPPAGFTGGAVTVGNFDGVHRGHRALLDAAARWAKQLSGPVVAVTFDPPPYRVLFPHAPPRPPLTTMSERAALLHEAGATHVVILHTTSDLLALTPEAFFADILQRQLGAKAAIEGYDFHFGHKRAGDTATLRALCESAGIVFEEVPPLTVGGEPVSSSRIRATLLAGDVAAAADLLGRPYRVTGTVVTGAKRGRTIGFPTANLGGVPTVLPGNGVYAVRAIVDGTAWPAAANVGPNPTFGEDARKVEVHLLGYSGNLYSRPMSIEFVQKLRDTRPFTGVAELIEQIRQDIEAARRILTPEP